MVGNNGCVTEKVPRNALKERVEGTCQPAQHYPRGAEPVSLCNASGRLGVSWVAPAPDGT